jgi:hypothetical protein
MPFQIWQGKFKQNILNYISSIPGDPDANESETLHGSNHRLHYGMSFISRNSSKFQASNHLDGFSNQNPQGFIMRRWPSRNPTNGL